MEGTPKPRKDPGPSLAAWLVCAVGVISCGLAFLSPWKKAPETAAGAVAGRTDVASAPRRPKAPSSDRPVRLRETSSAYQVDPSGTFSWLFGTDWIGGYCNAQLTSRHGTYETKAARYDQYATVEQTASVGAKVLGNQLSLVGLTFSATVSEGENKPAPSTLFPAVTPGPFQTSTVARSIRLCGIDLPGELTVFYLPLFSGYYMIPIPCIPGLFVELSWSVGAGFNATTWPRTYYSGPGKFNTVLPARVTLKGVSSDTADESLYGTVCVSAGLNLLDVARVVVSANGTLCQLGFTVNMSVWNHDRVGTFIRYFNPLSVDVMLKVQVHTYDFYDMEWQWNTVWDTRLMWFSTNPSTQTILNDPSGS